MDLDLLKQILNLVREHELSELEVEQDGLRLKIRKDSPVVLSGPSQIHTRRDTDLAVPLSAGETSTALSAAGPLDTGDSEIELAVVKSPIVGTFYRSPEPAAPPFVDVGTTVKKGQVLCIIEAMKLMNEIDSEYDGEIVNVYVESGQPVQYGERLFAIRTK
jgi:acetyl-CoA carboxylase biotin carboxyl carrier protein